MNNQYLLPGRLGDDNRRFETDPRADPRLQNKSGLSADLAAGLNPCPLMRLMSNVLITA